MPPAAGHTPRPASPQPAPARPTRSPDGMRSAVLTTAAPQT
jgi:hypothetical protein